jgi:hypothetical protein
MNTNVMKFSHSDDELVKQPIGYWSWAAHTSVVDYIRKSLATVGITQPQWWVLNQLGDPAGVHTREGLTRLPKGYLNVGDQLQADIDDLIARNLIVDDSRACFDDRRRGTRPCRSEGSPAGRSGADSRGSLGRGFADDDEGAAADDPQHRRKVLASLADS